MFYFFANTLQETPSIVNKVKSLFSWIKSPSSKDKKPTNEDENNAVSDEDRRKSFLSGFNGVFKFQAPDLSRLGTSNGLQTTPGGSNVSRRGVPFRFLEGDDDDDEADLAANYRKLASFFETKGSQPLTAVEDEGIRSMFRKIQQKSANNSPENAKGRYPVTSIHTPSLSRFENYPNTANMFVPRNGKKTAEHGTDDDNSSVSSSSVSQIKYTPLYTSSRKRTAEPAPFRPRKSTHLASIPTPYRPTSDLELYQPQAEEDDEEELPDAEPGNMTLENAGDENDSDTSMTQAPLSQTASTVLSLIEPLEEPKEEPAQPKKTFINPYASTALRSTRRSKIPRRTPAQSSGIIKSLELTMPDTPETADGPSQQASPSNSSTPSLQRKPNAAFVDKYKPARSSSLRKSLVPNGGTEDGGELKGSHGSTTTTIIDHSHQQQPKFTARWSVPDFADEDDEDGDTKLGDVSESATVSAKPSTPATNGLFSFEKPAAKPSSEENKLNGHAPAPLFKFGAVKEEESKAAFKFGEQEPKAASLFSFGSKTEDRVNGTASVGTGNGFSSAPKFVFGQTTSAPPSSASSAPSATQNGFQFTFGSQATSSASATPTFSSAPAAAPMFGATTPAPSGFQFGSGPVNGGTPKPEGVSNGEGKSKSLFGFGSNNATAATAGLSVNSTTTDADSDSDGSHGAGSKVVQFAKAYGFEKDGVAFVAPPTRPVDAAVLKDLQEHEFLF